MLSEERKSSLLEKRAKLRMTDIEDEIGTYFGDKQETKVRKMIGQERGKSFAMRHPYLTGIPTLGIAPSLANARAKEKIIRQLARGDVNIQKQLNKTKKSKEDKKQKDYEAETARLKATDRSRAAKQYATAGAAVASEIARSRQKEKEAGVLTGVGRFSSNLGTSLKNLVTAGTDGVSPLTNSLAKALVLGGGAAGIYGGVKAVDAVSDKAGSAISKHRSFNKMLEENPSLAKLPKSDAAYSVKVFRTLHSFNPKMAKDPLVAGSFVRRALQFKDEGIQPMDVKTLAEVGKQMADAKRGESTLERGLAATSAFAG